MMDELLRDYLEEKVAKQLEPFYKAFGREPPMAIKHGTTNEVTRKIGRSKYATDIMYRLWDAHNSCWITVNSRSVWSSKRSVEKIRESLVDKGRDPNTITVERVFVEHK